MQKVYIELKNILDYLTEGISCKAEIDQSGESYILPENAKGYEDSIAVQHFNVEDFKECKSLKEYKEWLATCLTPFIIEHEGKSYSLDLKE